nr:hypothetical protein [Actinospica acidiphila]
MLLDDVDDVAALPGHAGGVGGPLGHGEGEAGAFGGVEPAFVDHAVEDVVPALLDEGAVLGVRDHVVLAGGVDEGGEVGGASGVEFGGVHVVVGVGGGLDAVGAAAEEAGVEVALEDLVLGLVAVQLDGDEELLHLAGDGLLLAQVVVLHVLLGDGGAGLLALAGDGVPGAADHGLGVDGGLGVEVAVLGGEDGVLGVLRDLGEGDVLPVDLAVAGDDGAVGVEVDVGLLGGEGVGGGDLDEGVAEEEAADDEQCGDEERAEDHAPGGDGAAPAGAAGLEGGAAFLAGGLLVVGGLVLGGARLPVGGGVGLLVRDGGGPAVLAGFIRSCGVGVVRPGVVPGVVGRVGRLRLVRCPARAGLLRLRLVAHVVHGLLIRLVRSRTPHVCAYASCVPLIEDCRTRRRLRRAATRVVRPAPCRPFGRAGCSPDRRTGRKTRGGAISARTRLLRFGVQGGRGGEGWVRHGCTWPWRPGDSGGTRRTGRRPRPGCSPTRCSG